jgi:hypothetical protein
MYHFSHESTMVTFSSLADEHLLLESPKQPSFASCSEFFCVCVEEEVPFFLEKEEESHAQK